MDIETTVDFCDIMDANRDEVKRKNIGIYALVSLCTSKKMLFKSLFEWILWNEKEPLHIFMQSANGMNKFDVRYMGTECSTMCHSFR